MHQNIASIFSKKNQLEVILSDLQDKDKEPDVICLSETFVSQGSEKSININRFNLASSFCRKTKRGGVCILVHKGVTFKEICLKEYASEGIIECCGVEITSQNIIIMCFYRTPNSCPFLFLTRMANILHKFRNRKNKKLVLAGDFNINTLKESKVSKELTDITINFGLIFHIKEPTRNQSCIDHIISDIKTAYGELCYFDLSDHNTAQILNIPVERKDIQNDIHFKYIRDYCSTNILKFKEYLNKLSFHEVYCDSNINDAFNNFHNSFTLLYRLCFPLNKIKVKQLNGTEKWITKGLKISCKVKRLLRYKYYKQKSEKSKIKYKAYSKLLRRCFDVAQRKCNDRIISSSKNKCKAAWKIIKNQSEQQQEYAFINEIDDKGKLLTDPVSIASAFNNHLIGLTNNQKKCSKPKANYSSHSMFLIPYKPDEISKIIKSLNNTSAEGHDEISSKVVKSCSEELSPILTYLINLSFEMGCFPDLLKISVVKPLFKKGDRKQLNNYRPITLISVLAKVFEKAMHKRITDFIIKFDIIKDNQYAFQKNKSTTLACYNLINKVINNLDERKPTFGIFFDMTRAFDFVSHDLLIDKLDKNGIRGLALSWITSYLENRTQCVEITDLNDKKEITKYKSTYECNRFGVPQGSILGPILFLFYINDLPDITKYECTLFADDISIIITQNDNIDIESEMNDILNLIITWLNDNNLQINLDKTNYIHFSNYGGKITNLNVEYHSQKIEDSVEVKFLGIVLDRHCNWKAHVGKVCTKLNRFVYVLYRLRRTAELKTILTAYYGYVDSVLKYGLLIWGNSTDINKAFIVQKKCVRAMLGLAPYESCKPAFQKLEILPLPCMYILEVATFVRKHPIFFKKASEMFPRNTRNSERLVLDRVPKTALYQRNVNSMCIKIFNAIPKEIKNLPDTCFQRKLRKWLISKNFYSVKDFVHNNNKL